MKNFFGVTSKKGHVFFCKRWVPFFEDNNAGRHFCPDFQRFCPHFLGILPEFSTYQNCWGALAPLPPPPPTPLLPRDLLT